MIHFSSIWRGKRTDPVSIRLAFLYEPDPSPFSGRMPSPLKMILARRIRIDLHMDPNIAPRRFPAARLDVLRIFQLQPFLVIPEVSGKGLLRERLLHVVIAPPAVGRVKLPGCGMGVLLKADIALRCQEVEDVVVLLLRCLDIACGAVADRKGEIIGKQTVLRSSTRSASLSRTCSTICRR